MITIKQTDPVRNAIASLDSYSESKGHAIRAISEALADYGYSLAFETLPYILDFHGRDGRMLLDICKGGDDCVNGLAFAWYTMSSGRIELTAYIS